ncbi:AsmA-like C-terminal region-containing protein [Croceibacter atlanticus]|uniref:AsmA family protein n=1 Tax=Croceibacter atlanticus TaxID=313588 RepID=UPI001C5E00C8|nr:AsmA-like C-terminal region-containing protein [Croceibacter atlanticus]MBW4969733.1 AsmA family protein [Croceibacter atlanticus]
MKKILKIFGIFVLILVIGLIAAPFLFKGTIEKLIKKTINNNVNAQVEWRDLDLTLFSSFPDATVVIKDFSVVNNDPFKGDTLASGERLELQMGIKQLLKKENEQIKVDELNLEKAYINIKVDSLGNANYDIAKEQPQTIETPTDTTSSGFTFDLSHYEIKDSRINYLDESTKTFFKLKDVNHVGNGDLSVSKSTLETQTNALVSLDLDGVNYLEDHTITLDANFELDLDKQKYTFLENEAKINELPLTFNGFVQVNEDNNDIDITFKTPSSDFKNFLAIIPKTYSKNLDGVDTTGDFIVDGKIKGIVDDTHIPTLDIKIRSSNASFKYAELPKRVNNITINADIKNETGIVEDTYINIGNLTFKIDQDVFAAKGSFRNLTENMLVNLSLKGSLDLANIEKVYPLNLEQDLNGRFTTDLTTIFDMNSVEREQYQNIKSNGTASLKNFSYKSPDIPNELKVANADVSFKPGNISLNSFAATSGQTDISATGSIQNLIPFLMSKQDLKGNFNVNSNTFKVSDFMVAEDNTAATKTTSENTVTTPNNNEAIKIPDFLAATMNFNVKKVIYDDIELSNATGTIAIEDEKASLTNVKSSLFGGNIALNGNVNTKGNTPTFAMDLDLNSIDIDQSFKGLDLLQGLAPIAKALQGALNTNIKLNGNLNSDLTPQLQTIAGNAFAKVLTAKVNAEQSPLLARLSENVAFLNLDNLNLNNLETYLTFDNGNIQVKPFDFNIKGIKVTAGGTHGLDQNMNYNVTLDVPAKYMGSEVSGLLSKLSAQERETMTVALPIGLTGTFNSPKVNLNTQAAVNSLTQRIIDKQKDDLKDKGKDFLGNILGGNRPKDSTTVQQDSVKAGTPKTNEDAIKDAAKDILGGLFGKKKTKAKDSVN